MKKFLAIVWICIVFYMGFCVTKSVLAQCPTSKCECDLCECEPQCHCGESCPFEVTVTVLNPADQAYNYYDSLNDQEAQRTVAMYQVVQSLVNRGLVERGPDLVVVQALIQNIAGMGIQAQLRFNSARDDEDKLRAAADSAAILRFWPRPQEILQKLISSAQPPKPKPSDA